MTIEEASFILANIDRRVCDDELSEALDMAIEVLEQLKEKPEYIDTQHVGMVLKNVPKQPDNCKIYDGICGYPIEACSECPMHPKKTYIDADMLKEIKGIFNKPNVATILPDETYIESCEDCISRKVVLDYIDKMPSELTTDGRRMIRRRTLEEYISDTLPSITPSYNSIKTELKSCEDCISRVLEYIEESEADLWHKSENELVCQDIKELLPVIPTRKTGRWINSHVPESILCECSACGFTCGAYSFNYCPNCGCKMESEE